MPKRWVVLVLAGALLVSVNGCRDVPGTGSTVTPVTAIATPPGGVTTPLVAAGARAATPATAGTVMPSDTLPPATPTLPPSETPEPALTTTPAPALAPLSEAPLAWDALGPWLADAWQDRRDPAEVRAALMAAGWRAAWLNAAYPGAPLSISARHAVAGYRLQVTGLRYRQASGRGA